MNSAASSGERFEAEGGPLVGYVCPSCFGGGGSDLVTALRGGAKRLRGLAKALEAGVR